MSNQSKQIVSGLILGIISTLLGVILYMFFMTNEEIGEGIIMAYRSGFLGKIIGLGALPNLILFSYFIKKKYMYQARGVLLATFFAALVTLYLI